MADPIFPPSTTNGFGDSGNGPRRLQSSRNGIGSFSPPAASFRVEGCNPVQSIWTRSDPFGSIWVLEMPKISLKIHCLAANLCLSCSSISYRWPGSWLSAMPRACSSRACGTNQEILELIISDDLWANNGSVKQGTVVLLPRCSDWYRKAHLTRERLAKKLLQDVMMIINTSHYDWSMDWFKLDDSSQKI